MNITNYRARPKSNHRVSVDGSGNMRGSILTLALLMSMTLALLGCATYGERVAPVPLPEAQQGHVNVDGAKLVAQAYVDPGNARSALGFDARQAGLLPVRFVVDNQAGKRVSVTPTQTFLIDDQGQAWPLLTAEQAYDRVKGHVDVGETVAGAAKPAGLLGAAGALVGAAVGVVTGENVGTTAAAGAAAGVALGGVGGGAVANREVGRKISDDLSRESLRNRRVQPGELAYGYLFFPGKNEAKSAKQLRLGLHIGNEEHIVKLLL
jgi:hypothetical protein